MYGMLGLAEQLHILICINSTGNCVHYMYGMSGFAEKFNVQNCGNSTGNSLRYMNGMSKFAKKLNIPISENSTGNCVQYLCTACLDLQKNSKSKTTEIQFEIAYNTCTEC